MTERIAAAKGIAHDSQSKLENDVVESPPKTFEH
jgi:hypothetical protein